MAGSLLSLDGVTKAYAGKTVISRVNLELQKGEFCSLVGPSGCGKSSLLRMIVGEEKPDTGRLILNGHLIVGPSPKCGIVYQRYSLYPHLSVLQNVLMGYNLACPFKFSRRHRLEYNEHRDEATSILQRVGLEKHLRKYPHELSGGMQQRVSMVQSLIRKPMLLLMDEPFGALDPVSREDAQALLNELWEEYSITILFITHDISEAILLGQRVLVLSQYHEDTELGAKVVNQVDTQDMGLRKYAQGEVLGYETLIHEIRRTGFSSKH